MTQRTRRQRRRGGIGSKLLIVGGAVFAIVAIAVIAVTSWVLDVAADAPSLTSCKPIDSGGNSALYAADGSKLGVIASDEAHTPVAIDRIPKVQLATVAIEDQRFYEHGAVDAQGILRAALKNLEAGEAVEGGSTITQQLVRNLCIPNPERTSSARSKRRSWRSSTPSATAAGKSSASTSTSPPTGRSRAAPRSGSRPPRGSTSTARSGS